MKFTDFDKLSWPNEKPVFTLLLFVVVVGWPNVKRALDLGSLTLEIGLLFSLEKVKIGFEVSVELELKLKDEVDCGLPKKLNVEGLTLVEVNSDFKGSAETGLPAIEGILSSLGNSKVFLLPLAVVDLGNVSILLTPENWKIGLLSLGGIEISELVTWLDSKLLDDVVLEELDIEGKDKTELLTIGGELPAKFEGVLLKAVLETTGELTNGDDDELVEIGKLVPKIEFTGLEAGSLLSFELKLNADLFTEVKVNEGISADWLWDLGLTPNLKFPVRASDIIEDDEFKEGFGLSQETHFLTEFLFRTRHVLQSQSFLESFSKSIDFFTGDNCLFESIILFSLFAITLSKFSS